jgi:membrane protein DedA with SNARE-associated domain
LTEELIKQLGYVGIGLILVLGGLGLPIPEEAPIILAAVLTRNGQLSAPLALASCLGGVLLGDFVVYSLGFFYGEKVLSLPLTRRLLTRQREAQIKGYFHRHGFKILVSGRFVPGFRTAAYLTAGILKLPALKLLVTDLIAASLSTAVMFGLGFVFASQIEKGIREVQQWITVLVAAGVAGWLLYRFDRARRRAGLPVGPPVLDSDEVPLPAVDLEPAAALGGSLATPFPVPGAIETPATPAAPPEGAKPIAAGASGGSEPGPGSRPRSATSEDPIRRGPGRPSHRAGDAVGIDVEPAAPQPSMESSR